jgi:hypothetical protein
MRLVEIIDTEYIDTQFVSPKKKDTETKIGSGRYSTVSKADDFSVNKKYKRKKKNIDTDPYYIYVKTISDNKLAEKNPYFPRIYSVKSNRVDDENNRPDFNMEILTPISDISSDIIYNIGKHIMANAVTYDLNFQFYLSNHKNVIGVITTTMNRALHSKNLDEIKDSMLKNALKVIMNIRDKYPQCRPDIHPDNIMVRLTPHGPQIVLTDPLH